MANSKKLYESPGFPHEGWHYRHKELFLQRNGECRLCGASLKYGHFLTNELFPELLCVGIECAKLLIHGEDYETLFRKDSEMRALKPDSDFRECIDEVNKYRELWQSAQRRVEVLEALNEGLNKKLKENVFTMQKPANYDNTKVGGDFTPVECGGHIAVIKAVKEQKTKTGKDMLVVYFDFGKGDKQEGYFASAFEDDVRPEKKWPYQGTQYVVTADNNGNCTRNFKSFITCAEESNKNFEVNWDAKDFGAQFKGKAIGAVFGIVEDEYNGRTTKRPQLRWFRNVKGVQDAKVPEPKLLPGGAPAPANDDSADVPF